MLIVYITSHGFGHASRSVEVVRAIRDRAPDLPIVIRSSAPRWFLESALPAGIEIQPCDTDTGVIQANSLHVDEAATAAAALEFYKGFSQRVEQEAALIRRLGAAVVLADIPPLAFAAAAAAGVPSIALGNFTWDWIYEGYPHFEAKAPGVVDTIRRAYASASLALRLPMHGGFEPMRRVTRDITLIARIAKHPRSDTRSRLQIPDDVPVALASFGGHGLPLPYAEIARRNRLTLITTDHETAQETNAPANLRRFTSRELADQGLRYEDLVAAADVVVSKPGYGIISECVANGAALLYTLRGHFVEQDVLVAAMPRVLRCHAIEQSELISGEWSHAVRAVLGQPAPLETLRTDGASEAADHVVAMLAPARR